MKKQPSTDADGTKKSRTSRELTSHRPSGLDAANPCSTQIEPQFSLSLDKETVMVLLAVIDSLAREFLNGDCWYLALGNAARVSFEVGIPEAKVKAVLDQVISQRNKRFKQNPMHGMF